MDFDKKEIKHVNMDIKSVDVDLEKGIFKAIVTSEHIDHDGEVVKRDGLNLKTYKTNGILLYNHDPNRPLGASTGSMRNTKDGLLIEYKFAKVDTPALEYIAGVYSLVKQGVLKTMSIGFRRLDARMANAQDKKLYGKNVRFVTNKAVLVEVSIVSVPANSEALIQSCKELNLDPKLYGIEAEFEIEVEDAPVIAIEESKDINYDEIPYNEDVVDEVVEEVSEEISKLIELDKQLEADITALNVDIEKESPVALTAQELLVEQVKKELRKDYDNKEVVRLIKEAIIKNELFREGKIYF